jgi:hypothetical protein
MYFLDSVMTGCIFALLSFLYVTQVVCCDKHVVVDLPVGKVQGVVGDGGYAVFRGIRCVFSLLSSTSPTSFFHSLFISYYSLK